MPEILRKCSENCEAQVRKFTFFTCQKSILTHSLRVLLLRSKLFFDDNGNLFFIQFSPINVKKISRKSQS